MCLHVWDLVSGKILQRFACYVYYTFENGNEVFAIHLRVIDSDKTHYLYTYAFGILRIRIPQTIPFSGYLVFDQRKKK
jgi:hypothetical protein